MSANKGYNPFSLDRDHDEPTFVNEVGVRWWQIAIGEQEDGTAFAVDDGDGGAYVIVKDRKIIYGSKDLEHLAVHFDILRIDREMP